MPKLAICSRDLHWHWINRTLLCDTMEVSMLSRAWLTIAQHVFQPALTSWQVGQSWFREKLSPANREQRLSRWADFAKNCLPRIGSKVLRRFREKYRAHGRQNMGSNMWPRYIQFCDIHDRDISGLPCTCFNLPDFGLPPNLPFFAETSDKNWDKSWDPLHKYKVGTDRKCPQANRTISLDETELWRQTWKQI